MQKIISQIKEGRAAYGIELNSPAANEEIRQLEKELKFSLPKDFKEFYRFSNGFDSAEDLFTILPLSEIIDKLVNDKGRYGYGQFPIAEYMIWSDSWIVEVDAADTDRYGIYNANHDTEEELLLSSSFARFLKHFLEGGVFEKNGLYDWYEKVKIK